MEYINKENNEYILDKTSKIINKKIFVGSYIGIKNNYKQAELMVYTNKNGSKYHFIMRVFARDNREYKQGVLINQLYINCLTDSLGKQYKMLTNQEALKLYWQDMGLCLDNILIVGF